MISEKILSRFAEVAPHAEHVAHVEVSFADGSEPSNNKCHENVARYLAERRQGTVVRGWLVTSGFLFDKHSVTPLRAPTPFIEHPGSEEEFWSLPEQFSLLGIES